MKHLKKLFETNEISKKAQKTIHGGRRYCDYHWDCPGDDCCSNNVCWPFGTPGHLCDPPANI